MIYVIILLGGVLVASLYANWNLLSKVELYEEKFVDFYINVRTILTKARELDKRSMFEKDDEVGVLFTDLIITIGELRYIIYGEEEDEESLLDDGNGSGYYRV